MHQKRLKPMISHSTQLLGEEKMLNCLMRKFQQVICLWASLVGMLYSSLLVTNYHALNNAVVLRDSYVLM